MPTEVAWLNGKNARNHQSRKKRPLTGIGLLMEGLSPRADASFNHAELIVQESLKWQLAENPNHTTRTPPATTANISRLTAAFVLWTLPPAPMHECGEEPERLVIPRGDQRFVFLFSCLRQVMVS